MSITTKSGTDKRGATDGAVRELAAAKLYNIIRAPRVSEKTARLQEVSNQYVFEVATTATKSDIRIAIEKLFDVKVEAVNVLNVKGKNKAFKFRMGRRPDWRKAYVKLADGQSIDVMAKA